METASYHNCPLATAVLDATGCVKAWNPAAASLFGWQSEEVIGRSLPYYPETENKPSQSIFSALAQGSQCARVETCLMKKDGSRVDVGISASVLSDSEDSHGGLVIFHEDITARKQFIEELARLYQRSQEEIRLRDEFIALISHELKTPLASLKMQLQMLQRNPQLALQRGGKLLALAERTVNELSRHVADLSDGSGLASEHLVLHLDRTDLIDLVQSVVERYSESLAQADCSLELSLDDSIHGMWDRFRLEQVLCNLLDNVLRYAPGRPIRITARKEEKMAVLTVWDQGQGISKSLQSRIFRRFVRGKESRKIGGQGLGLYIVRIIVEAHGGSVKVSSEPGNGAVFTIRLPQEVPGERSAAPDPSTSKRTKINKFWHLSV